MSKKIGRNDPCPCGSGRKYKNCCLGKKDVESIAERHDNRDAVTIAAIWLINTYKKAIDKALIDHFYRGEERKKTVLKNLLDSGNQALLAANMEEWIVTEAFIPYEGELTDTPEIIYNSSIPKLTGADYKYLEDIAYVPLLLYEVQKVELDKKGLWVVNLVDKGEPFFVYSDNAASFRLWDIFGARYLGEEYGSTFTDACYPLERVYALDCMRKLARLAQENEGSDIYEMYAAVIPSLWLKIYDDKEDFALHVYAVKDWEVLEEILNSGKDIKKTHDGWKSTSEQYFITRTEEGFLHLTAFIDEVEEAKKWLESLAGALVIYKESLDYVREETVDERDIKDEMETDIKEFPYGALREKLTKFYGEEWLDNPLSYLEDLSPLEAAKDEKMREKLTEVIKNNEHLLSLVLKECPEDIDLWGRLGIQRPVIPE